MPAPSEALIGEFIDAAARDPRRAARLLDAHPSLLDARWIHAETVLHFLAVEGFADGVEFLVERGAHVDAVNEFGDTALIDAVTLGNADIAEILLRHGANPNAPSRTHDSMVHVAVRSGDHRLVELLIAAGADARQRTDLGESVFDVLPALGPERERVAAVLAAHGVVPDES